MIKKLNSESQLCDCHCGGYAKPGKEFIWGHKPKPIPNHHECACIDHCGILVASDKTYAYRHSAKKGKHPSEETKQKMRHPKSEEGRASIKRVAIHLKPRPDNLVFLRKWQQDRDIKRNNQKFKKKSRIGQK